MKHAIASKDTKDEPAAASKDEPAVASKDEPAAASKDEPANEKIRIEDPEVGHAGPSGTVCDIDSIVNGEKLSDPHINFAQRLLKQQFQWLDDLQSTLLQSNKHVAVGKHIKDQLQVIHSRGDHWVLASTVGSKDGEVYVYDSMYHSLDKATTEVVINLFHSTSIKLIDSQKQKGGQRLWTVCHCYCYCYCSSSLSGNLIKHQCAATLQSALEKSSPFLLYYVTRMSDHRFIIYCVMEVNFDQYTTYV